MRAGNFVILVGNIWLLKLPYFLSTAVISTWYARIMGFDVYGIFRGKDILYFM